MTAIRSVDSLKYGAGLFGYFLAIVVVGGGLLGLGLALGYSEATSLAGAGTLDTISKTDLAAGGVLSFLGSFVLLTGIFGIVHKLVADSVAAGVSDSQFTPDASVAASESDTATPAAEAAETDDPPKQPAEPESAETKEDPAPKQEESITVPPGVEETTDAESEPESDPQPETDTQPTKAQPASASATQSADTETAGETSLSEMFNQSEEGQPVEPPEKPSKETDSTEAVAEYDPVASTAENERGESTADADAEPAETDTKTAEPPREPTPEEIAFGSSSSDDGEPVEPETMAPDEVTDEADDTEPPASSGKSKSVGNKSGKDPLADPGDE